MASLELSYNRSQFESALKALFDGLDVGATPGEAGISAIRLNLINYIKAILNELTFDGLEGITFKLSDTPNLSDPIDLLINALVDPVAKDVILSAPLSSMKPTLITGNGTPNTDTKTGYIVLPDSFLRLMSLQMNEWKRDVVVAITPQSPIYKKQQHAAIRGGLSKPVAVLNWKNDGTMKRILEYYSVKTSHAIKHLLYIPVQAADVFISDNPKLLDSLAWACAGKIMQITGMINETKLAQERVAQSYLNLLT